MKLKKIGGRKMTDEQKSEIAKALRAGYAYEDVMRAENVSAAEVADVEREMYTCDESC